MDILVLGGTGAMGAPLVKLLNIQGYNIFVTSRSYKEDEENIHYILGNALDNKFLEEILRRPYDAIIDFMMYGVKQFEKRLPLLLKATKHYFFFSSSRVYAQSNELIKETSPRLLDISEDKIYLQTEEYALVKAKEEDLLQKNRKNNWTIIRPYITYNKQRLQLGVYEKENWLYRAMHGRTIVLTKDILKKTTSLTYGLDVAIIITKLIGNVNVYGQTVNVVTSQFATWSQILEIYINVFEEKMGCRPKIKVLDDSTELQSVWSQWQIKYDRLYDRKFDDSKTRFLCGNYEYKDMYEGLRECMIEFLENPQWLEINWEYEAWADKMTGEHTSLKEISGKKMKLKYLKLRYF